VKLHDIFLLSKGIIDGYSSDFGVLLHLP